MTPPSAPPKTTVGEPALGDPASGSALARLRGELGDGPRDATGPLDDAVGALAADDFATALKAAERAAARAPDNGLAWYVLAIAREKLGLFPAALEAYEQALARLPDHADLANDLGRLAMRVGLPELAAPLFGHYLQSRPDSLEAQVNLAAALRDQHRYAEAVEVLRPALAAAPGDGWLWNALGVVVSQQGDPATAATFFREALRLAPDLSQARYHLSGALLDLDDPEAALAELDAALAAPNTASDAATMAYARALTLLCAGRVAEGWDAYAARLSPDFPAAPDFRLPGRPWTPGESLGGRSLLAVGEQGLGDEVMFAGLVPDLLAELGEGGRLSLAVEPRLVSLFARSFPVARVVGHATDRSAGRPVRTAPALGGDHDLWAPIGSFLSLLRPTAGSFPARPAYLRPDPARVTQGRAWLETLPAGRKVGVVWKSLKLGGERRRGFAPFAAWAPVFAAPDVVFVNLQYGDCAEEIAQARAAFGATLWTPPGLDLKDDLDGVAALCAALDGVAGFANATLNLAGAVGAPVGLVVGPGAWPRLGTDRYPWYPTVRLFAAAGFDAWDPALAALADWVRRG